jgi:hypothetical protein
MPRTRWQLHDCLSKFSVSSKSLSRITSTCSDPSRGISVYRHLSYTMLAPDYGPNRKCVSAMPCSSVQKLIGWPWMRDLSGSGCCLLLITVAAQSKAWTVFVRSNIGIGGSNPTWGMNVCVCLFCYPVCRQRPCDSLIPRPRSPTVCVKRPRNWKSGQGPAKGCRAIDRLLFHTSPGMDDRKSNPSETERAPRSRIELQNK